MSELTSQYEVFGYSIQRYMQKMATSISGLEKKLTEFLDVFEKAPLFIVGLDMETYVKWHALEVLEHNGFTDFRLPYPRILLDLPSGIVTGSADPGLSEAIMIYVAELSPHRFFIEILRSHKEYKKRFESLSPEEKELANLVSDFQSQTTDDEVGEAQSVILTINPDDGTASYTYSREYCFDCDAKVKAVDVGPSFATFSTCGNGILGCKKKSGTCNNLDAGSAFSIKLVKMIIDYINSPERFVVKVTPEKTARELRFSAKGKCRNFTKKQYHIVLDAEQVRDVVRASRGTGGTHASPLPHSRRGHWRMLKADRFKEKKQIWVRPADINKGMKVTLKKMIYEVIS